MSLPSTEPRAPRIIVITGGAGGIGWASAQLFAASGDRVAIVDIDGTAAAARAAELGADHMAVQADIGNEADVVRAIAAVAARYGRIDVLVNNAGVVDAVATPALAMTIADYDRLMAINLEGAYVAAREAGRIMLAQGGGAIVNVASLAGVVAVPNRNAYAMSKAAMIGWTRALACEWAAAGVRVNAVLPGYVMTEILAALVRSGKVELAQVERRIPLGRLAQPAEIAALVHHLASDDAAYVTGAAVTADGGYQAFGGTADAAVGGAQWQPAVAQPRVVLITGAASGIGAALARRLAAAGDSLLLFDRNADALTALAAELGPGHFAVEGDVRNEADAASAVAAALGRFGRIDGLVNNAGIADVFRPTVDQSLDDFRRVMAVDLTGALIMAKAVAPALIAGGGGSIVNLASIAGLLGLAGRNAYCAAKAGIIMMTRSLACEWAAQGIRVNAVAPGYIATPGMLALEAAGRLQLAPIRARAPMARLGQPGEIAAAIDFLADARASYITGTVYCVDGGWSAAGDAPGITG